MASKHGPPKLTRWAFFPPTPIEGFANEIRRLASIALDESWDFRDTQSPNHQILRSYLSFTFYKLWLQRDVPQQDWYAAFDTGLVDKRYEPIYAFFYKNQIPNQQPWVFQNFCFAGEDKEGKLMVSTFRPLPQPARYFDDPRSMFYDIKAGEPSVDWQHVIIENIDRLPLIFLEEHAPKSFPIKDVSKMSEAERTSYFDQLARAVENDPRAYRAIKNRLGDALELAIKRIRWNFKTAIPQYFPTRDEMSLLLPLALVSDDEPDVALVVKLQKSGNYLGHTILPLAWAYNNARLVCRPNSDWLNPGRIKEDRFGDETSGEESDSTATVPNQDSLPQP